MKRIPGLLLGLAASGILFPPAAAGLPDWARDAPEKAALAEYASAEVVLVLYEKRVKAKREGSKEVRIRQVFTVRDRCESIPDFFLFHQPPHRDKKKMRAWHRFADGTVVKHDDLAMREGGGKEVYSEGRSFFLRVPGVDAGDMVAYELEYVEQLDVAGTDDEAVERAVPVAKWVYRLELPGGWIARGYRLIPHDSIVVTVPPDSVFSEGRKMIWIRKGIAGKSPDEPFRFPSGFESERFGVSYGSPDGSPADATGWGAVRTWYAGLCPGGLTDELKDLADSLTGRAPTAEIAAERIARYVRESIAYRQVYLGDGGYRPHDPSEVQEKKYGDCKDQALLAVNLLRRRRIEAVPVLVQAGYRVPAWCAHPTKNVFNHLIVAVRNEGGFLYFDPTAKSVPFGRLPMAVEGAAALMVDPESDAKLLRLPRSAPGDNTETAELEISLRGDLSAYGEGWKSVTGHPAYSLDRTIRLKGGARYDEELSRELNRSFPGLRITECTVLDPDTVAATRRVWFRFEIPRLRISSGSTVFLQPNPMGICRELVFDSAERESHIYVGYPRIDRESARIWLPEGFSFGEIPEDVDFRNDFGAYRRTFRIENGVLTATREVELSRAVYPPDLGEDAYRWAQVRYEADRNRITVIVERGYPE